MSLCGVVLMSGSAAVKQLSVIEKGAAIEGSKLGAGSV
jgi:hypothetical protein